MTRNLRRLDATEADTLKAITAYLEILQKQGKLLYIRVSPSNVILSWNLIWDILSDLYFHRLIITAAFQKIKSSCFRKLPESQLGIADLIVFQLANGRPDVLCIEVKSAKGKLQDVQDHWAELAVNQGCRYIVARSFDEVMEALR